MTPTLTFSIDQAKQLIHRYITTDITMAELARETGQSDQTVSRCVKTKRRYNIPELVEYRKQLEQIHGVRHVRNILNFDDSKLQLLITLYMQGTRINDLRHEFNLSNPDIDDLITGKIHPHMQPYIKAKGQRFIPGWSGENSHRCKYTAKQVYDIIYRLRELKQTVRQISDETGMEEGYIRRIRSGKARRCDIKEYERLWKYHKGKYPFPESEPETFDDF